MSGVQGQGLTPVLWGRGLDFGPDPEPLALPTPRGTLAGSAIQKRLQPRLPKSRQPRPGLATLGAPGGGPPAQPPMTAARNP